MTTHRAIVDALSTAASTGTPVVLATVVRVTGSSYGGVGARMVVRIDGSTVGVVSGGCLETDLAERARQVHEEQKPQMVTYDTRADEDAAWGLGLGCNGLIDVLLEPMTPSVAGSFAMLMKHALGGSAPSVLASVIESREPDGPAIAAHALLNDASVESVGDWGDGHALELAAAEIDDAVSAGRGGLVRDFDQVQVAFEVINPAIRLVICGSGPDVLPLVRSGSELGWDLTVVDHRPVTPVNQERFRGAALAECADPLRLTEAVAITPHTGAVVMSHHFARDLDYVRALLQSDASYIGVLGPRARTERMLADMAAAGDSIHDSDRLHGPVGLDVGGDGPNAIALSIIAEVSTVLNARQSGHLRDLRSPLHGVASSPVRVQSS